MLGVLICERDEPHDDAARTRGAHGPKTPYAAQR